MTYKSKNSLVELVYALNKSQRLFLSRKWSYPPFCDYLYVQLYFAILRDSKRDYAQVKSSLTNIKTSQTANIQNELYVKILDHLKHVQKERKNTKIFSTLLQAAPLLIMNGFQAAAADDNVMNVVSLML